MQEYNHNTELSVDRKFDASEFFTDEQIKKMRIAKKYQEVQEEYDRYNEIISLILVMLESYEQNADLKKKEIVHKVKNMLVDLREKNLKTLIDESFGDIKIDNKNAQQEIIRKDKISNNLRPSAFSVIRTVSSDIESDKASTNESVSFESTESISSKLFCNIFTPINNMWANFKPKLITSKKMESSIFPESSFEMTNNQKTQSLDRKLFENRIMDPRMLKTSQNYKFPATLQI